MSGPANASTSTTTATSSSSTTANAEVDKAIVSAIEQKKLSAAEWRAKRELEEARKQGTAAPEIDEEGNAINPHIPQYSKRASHSLRFRSLTVRQSLLRPGTSANRAPV
jgi:hypothetical protein